MNKLVVGVKFRDSGKMYYFDPGDLVLSKGDLVIVNTSNGEDFGKIVLESRKVNADNLEELQPIIRKASEEDVKHNEHLQELCAEARAIFENCVSGCDLEMKLIDVQYTFDESKVIFYFTAEGRVDFRDLVKDLAGFFRARIELRQIGVRDEARKYAGIGICGRKCCCATWLNDFVPVSIKMAKEQDLSLNSTKISGICGRLLCCLTYEEAYYEELSKRMPAIGDELLTPDGMGTVYKLRTLDEAVLMRLKNDKDETIIKKFTLEELDEVAKHPELVNQKKTESITQEIEIPSLEPEERPTISKNLFSFLEEPSPKTTKSNQRNSNQGQKKKRKENSSGDKRNKSAKNTLSKTSKSSKPSKKNKNNKGKKKKAQTNAKPFASKKSKRKNNTANNKKRKFPKFKSKFH